MLSDMPPRWPRDAIERMKTPGSAVCRCILIRSPSTAPPVSGLEGSIAATATERPARRNSEMKASTSVDLPTPGAPVKPMTLAAPAKGRIRRRTAAPSSLSSISVIQRANAPASPRTRRAINASRFAGATSFAMSGDDKRLPEPQFPTQATDDLTMRNAELRCFNNPRVDVFGGTRGRAGDSVEPALHVGVASLLLEHLEARHMLLHAREIRPLGCPD